MNFPELFAEYGRLGVDCVRLSAYPVDVMLTVKTRTHAAINNYWVSLSAPAQTEDLPGPPGARSPKRRPGDPLEH